MPVPRRGCGRRSGTSRNPSATVIRTAGGFLPGLRRSVRTPHPAALAALRREALLANPLLDFDKLLLIRRSTRRGRSSACRRIGWETARCRARVIRTASPCSRDLRAGGLRPSRFSSPEQSLMVADVDLHFDGNRMLFSMIGSHNRWQIWECRADGSGLRQVTPGTEPDVDNYDAMLSSRRQHHLRLDARVSRACRASAARAVSPTSSRMKPGWQRHPAVVLRPGS